MNSHKIKARDEQQLYRYNATVFRETFCPDIYVDVTLSVNQNYSCTPTAPTPPDPDPIKHSWDLTEPLMELVH